MNIKDSFKISKTILDVVGDFYNIDLLDNSKYSCRKRKYAYPRMVASYIIIENKILNFRQTGLLYKCKEKPKGLNHASIINYINTVSCFLETDSIFKSRFLEIKEKCDLLLLSEKEKEVFKINKLLKELNLTEIKEIKELIKNNY